jgi:hypothetical protein
MGKLSGYYTPVLVFSPDQIFDLLKRGDGVKGLLSCLKILQDEAKVAAKYKWSDSNIRITNTFGEEYIFYISPKKNRDGFYEMSIWSLGEVSLSEVITLRDKDLSHNIGAFKHAVHIMDRFSKGLVVCSKCGDEHKFVEIKNNRFYSGVYCQKCWDGGVKQQEAKENDN